MKNKIIIALFLLNGFFSSQVFSQSVAIDSLKRIVSVAKTDTTKINLYNNIADGFKQINPDSVAFYAQKALVLSQKNNYGFGLANSYINKGNSNIISGNYAVAQTDFANATTEFQKLVAKESSNKKYQNGLARCFASLGIVFSEQNNYSEALEKYQKALKIYQNINDKPSIAKAFNNIGVVYKSIENKDKALDYFKKALAIEQEMGEQAAATSLTNIGVIYFEQKNYPQALNYYNKAEKLFETIDNKRGFALLNNYFGDYYNAQNDAEKAVLYYQKSIKQSEEIQDKFEASLTYYNLGKLYLAQKNNAVALHNANQSLRYAQELGLLDQTWHTEKLLSDIYEAQGNTTLALQHYKNYTAARDSLNAAENEKKLVRAEMKIEYEKQEALLKEKNKNHWQFLLFSIFAGLLVLGLIVLYINRQQVKKRLTLQKEIAEYEQKALHLQMNPHFVFNCLGAISSFIVQNGTDSALKYLSKFSKLMRTTLEYSKDTLIPIDKEIEALKNYLELEQLRFHNKFTFSIQSTDKVEFNMAIPPLLVQPFVENAILHGVVPMEGNGKIEVKFDMQVNQLVCTITDNGIGIAKSKKIKENSMQAHRSMAMEITKKRLEIMETTLSKSAQISIIENNGTLVTLRLPVQYLASPTPPKEGL